MALDLNADITGLRGADYNPRKISEEDLSALAESIATLGLVKPLIVRGDLLVAGHQRTKALRALGRTTAAVYRLPVATTVYDEIRFNQLHNGTDLDAGDEDCKIAGGFEAPGWNVVKPDRITANLRGKLATVRAEISRMIVKYGPWGGVVALQNGRVIHAAQYAIAARATRTPLTVYVLPVEMENVAAAYLGRGYGVFSYDGLERQTYIQTLAQMNRLRNGPSGKSNRSMLYETQVIPWLEANPKARVIDFGSGHGDYASALRGRGYNVHDVELFRRNRSQSLDQRAIHRMITQMVADLETHGPYDAVVMDSVLNSVDCLAAETAVMTVINMLCRNSGNVFYSGRQSERLDRLNRHTKTSGDMVRYIEFPDEHGFTALYRQGRWFYQKFHSRAQAAELTARFGFKAVNHDHGKASTTSWQIHARKVRDLPLPDVLAACDYEFNLHLGETERLGRNAEVKRAVMTMRGEKVAA